MTIQVTMPVLPDRQADKSQITLTVGEPPALPVPDNEIALYVGDDVPLHRAVEILNGHRWLWNGLRDRSLLQATDAVTGHLYSASDIDELNENTRRTSWDDTTPVTASDIGVGVSHQVATGLDATNMVESAFQMLRDYLSENYFKVN